jgi:hypothetical protein
MSDVYKGHKMSGMFVCLFVLCSLLDFTVRFLFFDIEETAYMHVKLRKM